MTQPENKPEVKPAVYDKKDQHDRIVAYVIPGERLVAVYDCRGLGSGFVGFTDRRVIFYDQSFIAKKKSMISIPYHQIIAVVSTDEGLFLSVSEVIIVTAAGKFTFEFRGADKAQWAYRYIMNQILTQHVPSP